MQCVFCLAPAALRGLRGNKWSLRLSAATFSEQRGGANAHRWLFNMQQGGSMPMPTRKSAVAFRQMSFSATSTQSRERAVVHSQLSAQRSGQAVLHQQQLAVSRHYPSRELRAQTQGLLLTSLFLTR
eukprot:1157355-Pelagomonas_calceolata.AAC.4